MSCHNEDCEIRYLKHMCPSLSFIAHEKTYYNTFFKRILLKTKLKQMWLVNKWKVCPFRAIYDNEGKGKRLSFSYGRYFLVALWVAAMFSEKKKNSNLMLESVLNYRELIPLSPNFQCGQWYWCSSTVVTHQKEKRPSCCVQA